MLKTCTGAMPNIWLMQCQLLTCTVGSQCVMAVVGLWVILLNTFNWTWLKRELKTNVNTVGFGFVVWEGIINWNMYLQTLIIFYVCKNMLPWKVHAMLHRYIVTRYIPKPHIIYWCISLNARYLKFICLHCRTVKSYSKANHTTSVSSLFPNHHASLLLLSLFCKNCTLLI